ncbi:flagellar biosynthesis protein FlhG [Lachnospiraceae bacterium]|nr:flagellar biosynthesis protein FlhG [Lachnospiraceae bacterium]
MDQAEKLRNIIKKNQVVPKLSARVITVTSGKGGVGKSNVAINLACQFRSRGKRVIIFDADFGLANIEVMFGAVPKHSLADLIYQGMEIREVITWGPMGIGFISGGSGIVGMNNLGKDNLDYLVRNISQLDSLADVIIIDTAAGISDAVIEFLVASNEILLVTTPEPTSITDSYSLLKALNSNPAFQKDEALIKVIANKVENEEEGRQLYNKLRVVVQRYLKLNMEYLGYVPYDNALLKAVMQQSPVSLSSPQAKVARAFEDVADTLMDIPHTERFGRRGMTGFFSSFLTGRKRV